MNLEPVDPKSPDLHAALTLASLPTDDLQEPGKAFFEFTEHDRTVGFGGFEAFGDSMLLRSVVVTPERRGSGCGRAMVDPRFRGHHLMTAPRPLEACTAWAPCSACAPTAR